MSTSLHIHSTEAEFRSSRAIECVDEWHIPRLRRFFAKPWRNTFGTDDDRKRKIDARPLSGHDSATCRTLRRREAAIHGAMRHGKSYFDTSFSLKVTEIDYIYSAPHRYWRPTYLSMAFIFDPKRPDRYALYGYLADLERITELPRRELEKLGVYRPWTREQTGRKQSKPFFSWDVCELDAHVGGGILLAATPNHKPIRRIERYATLPAYVRWPKLPERPPLVGREHELTVPQGSQTSLIEPFGS